MELFIMEFNDRTMRVLQAVVDSYIHTSVPVGSRMVTRKYAFNLSSATIRNIMADLEEMGYLMQPHTSAGRVPTDRGYRFYVDALREEDFRPDEDRMLSSFKKGFSEIQDDINRLMGEVAARVSALTGCLAFATPLRPDTTTLNRIQLYRFRGNRTVAMLLTDEGLVTSRVLFRDFGLSQKELDRISDFLNSEFSGHTIGGIRAEVLRQMSREKQLADILITKAMRICDEALVFPGCDIILSGVSELLGLPEFADRVNAVARAIEDKHRIVTILDGIQGGEGVDVIIGRENPERGFYPLSIVTAEYRKEGRPLGRVGMIGPTRMEYSRAIPMVEAMARFLSGAVSQR